jgi:GntR family transcriptional regulator
MIIRNVPLVDKVKREIVTRFKTVDFVDESGRLPSEEVLSRQFGVSRSTIRSALAALEECWLDEVSTFEDLIRNSSHSARTVLLGADFRPAGSSAVPLRVEPEAQILRIDKLFYSDENPILYSQANIPLDLVDRQSLDLDAVCACCASPVYQILEECFHSRVHHQVSEIRGGIADETMASQLSYQAGQPVLFLEEVGYDSTQKPLYHGLHYFRADLVSFRVVRRPVLAINSKMMTMGQP